LQSLEDVNARHKAGRDGFDAYPLWSGFPGAVLARAVCYITAMVKSLEQAIAAVERLPAEDQEQIGRTLLSHVEKLRALRAEVDKGIRSLDAGQGRESGIDDFLRQKNR
jgi:hypothetical protein